MHYEEAKAVVDLLVDTLLIKEEYRNNALDLLMNELEKDDNGRYALKKDLE